MTIAEDFNKRSVDRLPGYLGIHVDDAAHGRASLSMEVVPHLLAPNGFLHGGSVVALADTAAGVGCISSLPEGASGFTTIELKTNFIGTAREGVARCESRLVHGGRTTQVWDCDVVDGAGKLIATFRCTQLILWPRT